VQMGRQARLDLAPVHATILRCFEPRCQHFPWVCFLP
jgi:hypothetical protein